MKYIYALFLGLMISPLFSCQSDSKAALPKTGKHLFVKFYVRYLQTEKELKAEATFKEGDSLTTARSIVLNEVTFEDEAMKVQNIGKEYGVRYSVRKKGAYKNQYQFDFSGEQVPLSTQVVKMKPITSFSIKDGISKKSGMTFTWEGNALQSNQELVLLFTDENKKAFPVLIQGPTEQSEVSIPYNRIGGLSLGKGQLMLVQKQLEVSNDKNISKIIEMEFYSNNMEVEVKE